MSRFLQLLLCVGLIGFCSCHRKPVTNAQEGDSCTPRRAKTCGDLRLISEETTTLSEEDGFGPNLCQTTKVYEAQTHSYSYQRHCWKFGRFGNFCNLYCTRSSECDGAVVNITKNEVDCCDGFGIDPTQSGSSIFGGKPRHRRHGSHFSLKSNGCPIMLRDSVLDCLVDLGLTSFLAELGNVPELLTLLSSNSEDDESYTLFAPSNDAFSDLSDLERGSSRMILGGHIVNRTIFSSRLRQGQILTPFDDDFSLHVTTVFSGSGREIYLNGANITQADACQARNGIVHGLSSVIPLSDQNIVEVLNSQSSRFSTFSNLLEESGVADLLKKDRKSRTVFAPTNEALDELPSGAVECLLREENCKSLKQFVLIHVGYPTEYSTTLSQRSHIQTFTSRPNYWLVITAEGGSISITRDEITIEETDIPASNGVIHVLPEAIVAVDFEKLCPGTSETTDPPLATTTVVPEVVDSLER